MRIYRSKKIFTLTSALRSPNNGRTKEEGKGGTKGEGDVGGGKKGAKGEGKREREGTSPLTTNTKFT
jgi:hypothetical protein